MNNEETIVMQPNNNKANATENKSVNNSENTTVDMKKDKDTEKNSAAGRVAATVAAGTAGGAMGGVGANAANMLNTEEPEEEVEAQVEEPKPTPAPAREPEPEVETKEEEIAVTVDENGETDYTGNAGADPVAEAQPTSNETESEVQILGIYERTDENGVHQEMAVLTDGETVAAVVDTTGDGEANVFGIDVNHDGQFQEGEVQDISDQHIGMNQFEQEYIAQQQMEAEQQDTFAYNAQDETDFNNDADTFEV